MAKRTITVIGATGSQGGGVVDSLLADGDFTVRAVTRNPDSDVAKALVVRGVQVVAGDLLEPTSLETAFRGAHGAFVVTNFWDPQQSTREAEVGRGAVEAARRAGVEHLVWSTLPNCEELTDGRLKVVHFTGKARVDAAVHQAGFRTYHFVEAPFYFQNLRTLMAPQPLPSGGQGWTVPMNPDARVIHAGDVTEVGRAVSAAFSAGEKLPNGTYLAVCGGLYSWSDLVSTLNSLGHQLQVAQVPPDVYDGFYPGAHEMREMFQYFEQHTYFGPKHQEQVAATQALVPGGFTSFADWAKVHFAPS